MAYSVQIGKRQFHGLRGNLHMHTILSDGTKTHAELARIAGEAGLDFVIITDHNVRDTLRVTDRAYIIDQGRIVAHGAPEEIV